MIAVAEPCVIRERPLWPLDAPGMPYPGPDFLALVRAKKEGKIFVGDTILRKGRNRDGDPFVEFKPGEELCKLYWDALYDVDFAMQIKLKGTTTAYVNFIPGHLWGPPKSRYHDPEWDGPQPADVMVLGKMPWTDEARKRRNLVGAGGQILRDAIERLRIAGSESWYVANLVRFKPPGERTSLLASWIKDCLPLLAQELRIVQPKYILCLGSDASMALLGKKFKVGYMDGQIVDHLVDMRESESDPEQFYKCRVMTVVHPAQVAREPPLYRQFEKGLSRFKMLIEGCQFTASTDPESDIDHKVVETFEDAEVLVRQMEDDLNRQPVRERLVAWDAEWQGTNPKEPGSYVRLLQVSWKHKAARAFKLTEPGGALCFVDKKGRPAQEKLVRLLCDFMKGKRACGHFFTSDLEWMLEIGLDLREAYSVPLFDVGDKLAWLHCMDGHGGFDTGLAAHAVEETAMLGLETLLMRHTTCPRYDLKLDEYKAAYCKQKKIPIAALEGYGEFPDDVLIPYGNYDACGTRRLALEQIKLLDCDYVGNNCWEPFWESMVATRWILEIQRNGIMVDHERVMSFTKAFADAKAEVEKKIQKWADWPQFNIRSPHHVREFLFGEEFNGKIQKEEGVPVIVRPRAGQDGSKKGALSLHLDPLLDTGKPPKRWADLNPREIPEHTASTNKTVLSILAQESKEFREPISCIIDYRLLDQVIKQLLPDDNLKDDAVAETAVVDIAANGKPRRAKAKAKRKPVRLLRGYEDDLGNIYYEYGLLGYANRDGRIRTHLSPTTDSGRVRSYRPNLQNLSKKQDAQYERLLGKEYEHKLRSIFLPSPGHALIEFDYRGAELCLMAWYSGDLTMIDHVRRNQLSKRDPEFYDIHSNVACLAFGLNCEPTETGLEAIGKVHFRILAKNVIFGIAYGRGAKAIALQAQSEGRDIDEDEAQRVIDTIFSLYPGLVPFFKEARDRAIREGWLCNCFGRFRRFGKAESFKIAGDFERIAMNFGIQSSVASAVDRGLAYLLDARDNVIKDPNYFRLLLQMHDAGLIEAPFRHVEYLVEMLVPWAMTDCVSIYPAKLDGMPLDEPRGPYHLGVDIKVERRWGESYTIAECEELGIPVKYGKKAA